MSPSAPGEPLRFDRFEIRPAERTLIVAGRPVALGARAFDLLLALAERRDRVVSKRELLDIVWPGLVVEEHNITAQISTLRRLLGAEAITTVSSLGYRLTAASVAAEGSIGTGATLQQEIRFARSVDGTRIAFSSMGVEGYPVVNAAHWLGHLEHDWQTPVWLPWMQRLCASYRMTRYDSRGCGFSDRDVQSLTLDDLVADLEAVVDAAGLERFALLGKSQGGAISIAYAAKHPERVSHIVLCGAFVRGELKRPGGSTARREAVESMAKLAELGWGQPKSAFLQMFTSLFFPDATPEQMRSYNEIQRMATSARHAARLIRALANIDASACLAAITCPTLVLHCRGDAVAPFEEGRFIAASIQGARLERLDSDNHVPLFGEPAFEKAFAALESFLPRRPM